MSTAQRAQVPATTAVGIERRLALEILRGQRAPGTQLPPVRQLAVQHGVTAPTIQRVIDRLEAGGLVSTRRGSGVTVKDPLHAGDLSLLPLWFEALADQPDRATAMLADFLELRRVVAVHLVRTAAARIAASAPRLLELALALERAESLAEVTATDAAFTAAVVEASGQWAVAAVAHATSRLVREVPALAEAFYGDRAYHRRVLRRSAESMASAVAGLQAADAAAQLDEVLAAWDRRTVARFRRALVG
jgi:GntR family transcriptional repressor for pyruvate dehydrogenase complex